MAANEEKLKNGLPKIITVAKWVAGIGSLIVIIYMSTFSPAVKHIDGIFGVLCVFLFVTMSVNKKTKTIEFIAKISIAILVSYLLYVWHIFTILMLIFFPFFQTECAPGITKEKVLSLKPGININEVIEILGDPLDIGGSCSNEEGCRMKYATPGKFGAGFEFGLLIENNKLHGTVIELNDEYVYKCYKDNCPVIFNSWALDRLCSLSLKVKIQQ